MGCHFLTGQLLFNEEVDKLRETTSEQVMNTCKAHLLDMEFQIQITGPNFQAGIYQDLSVRSPHQQPSLSTVK
jgi:hypothetical protein